MELVSGSCGYRSKDASRENLRVLHCALVVSFNIQLVVCSEFFDHELSIFTEQVVGLGAHLDCSYGYGAGSPSLIIAPLGETCRVPEAFSGGVVKLVEIQCCGLISIPLFAYGATVVNDLVGVYLSSIKSVYGWRFCHWGCALDGRDECAHLGLINGYLSGLDLDDRSQQHLVCFISESMDYWVKFGFFVACTQALMKSIMENGLNKTNFKVSGLG